MDLDSDYRSHPELYGNVSRIEGNATLIKKITAALAAIVLVLSMGACSKMSEPFKDADRGSTNDGPADTLTFPDGFSNAATKCDHGNRVYVLFKQDKAYGAIAVVPGDPSCDE